MSGSSPLSVRVPMESTNLADREPRKTRELSAALEAQLARYERVPRKEK